MDIVAGKVLITFLEQLFLHIWYYFGTKMVANWNIITIFVV